ncbi:30S ribosomal protein S13 [Candidatus Micrarchaeota archaeon]|nr:30S ribosomal protein S13 [Candidatus Micrarchaeota archaeon]
MAKKEDNKENKKEAKETKEAAPKKVAPAAKKPVAKPQVQEKENYRGIIRIAGKDMSGELNLRRALTKVRGIGQTLAVSAADILTKELTIDPKMRIGEFDDEMIEKIDRILTNLESYPVPKFLLNRRSDRLSGEDRHVIMNDLIFENTQDVERDKKANTWKGYRHTYGQKVRGQKTRNTGRTGMAVGVLRKSIVGAAGVAAAQAATAGKEAAAAKPAAGAASAAKPAEKKPAAPATK